jgi:SSS family transporter
MVLVGVYFARRETSTEEFFLGGRKIPWWAAGLSIFGTQLSAITFMAIPATAYGSDWRRFAGQIMVLPIIAMVIFCFLPLFRRLNVTTAYEYLEARFSLTVRLFASSLFILFQLGRMGIVLLLPAIALSAVTGIDTYLCIALMGILATAYTTMGGISAVIWTDVLQVFVLIGGALLCLIVAVSDAGGISASIDLAQAAGKFDIFEWRWSSSDMVAWVLIVGFFFTNLVPYTTDQTVIQRYLTTSDEKQAARSLWLNLAITIPTGILFFGLGTALFVYYTGNPELKAALPEKADQLVPWFVVTHLPAGVAGLVVAGIFAAAMSSLDSSMNSIATAIVNDFVERFDAPGPRKDRLSLARKLTVLLGIIGTSAAMLLATYEIKYLFDFFQKVMGLFGGGLAGVFLLAVFTKKTNARGAFAGLVLGGLATIAVAFFTQINFLLYAAVGATTCVGVGYGVSLATGGNQKNLAGLTRTSLNEVKHEQA